MVGLIPAASVLPGVTSLAEHLMQLGYFVFLCAVVEGGLRALKSGTAAAPAPQRPQAVADAAPRAVAPRAEAREQGMIGGCRYVAHNDGSLDLETRNGWRRFTSVEAALAHLMRAELAA